MIHSSNATVTINKTQDKGTILGIDKNGFLKIKLENGSTMLNPDLFSFQIHQGSILSK